MVSVRALTCARVLVSMTGHFLLIPWEKMFLIMRGQLPGFLIRCPDLINTEIPWQPSLEAFEDTLSILLLSLSLLSDESLF